MSSLVKAQSIHSLHIMMTIPSPLLDDIEEGKCLPFIGAGFSMNAKLPDGHIMPNWDGLTRLLAEICDIDPAKGGPEVAEIYERNFGRVQLIETLRKALNTDVAKPGMAHRAFAHLPFDTIYTTNFDLLLEDANSLISKPYRSLVGELQMPFYGGPQTSNIVKMHGDLRHEEHIIFTRSDYDEFLAKYPMISTHLASMLITRTPLFIGYSLKDPDFGHIREVVQSRLGRFQRMAYVVQFNSNKSTRDSMLADQIHVIDVKIHKSESRDVRLAEMFRLIQNELDRRAGSRWRKSRPEMFEPVDEEITEASALEPDAAKLLGSSSNVVFVLMPFDAAFDELYHKLIAPAIDEAGFNPIRTDDIFAPGSVMEQIRAGIQQCRFCIADLTGRNTHVLFELGIAQALGKPTLLLSQDISDIPFDVAHQRVIAYSPKSLPKAKSAITSALNSILGHDRLAEARTLVKSGMKRAAVAELGVLLEHILRVLVQRHDLDNRRRKRDFISLGGMVQVLHDSEVISTEERNLLQRLTMIRNKAVHELAQPSKRQASNLLAGVESFIFKHDISLG